MNKRQVRAIMRKEWAEVFRQRMVLFTAILLPLMMAAMPLAIFYLGGDWSAQALDGALAEEMWAACPPTVDDGMCGLYLLLSQFLLMFMIMPLAIPATFAAYSVVGEKTTRSLEPLLAAPLRTRDLLIGKALAAVLPGVLATWGSYLLFLLGLWLKSALRPLAQMATDQLWLLVVLLLGPLMALLSVLVSLMVSSRVNDPRAAEQLSMLLILPLLGVLFAQIGGWITLNPSLALWAALGFLLADIGFLWLAESIFARESILTRWK